MKNTILEGLKAKFPGVSNSILTGLAESKAKTATTEEEATTAIEGVTFQMVLDSQATAVAQTAKANYEKKHGLKDGKPIEVEEPAKDPKPADDPAEPAWAKSMRERNEALEARLNKLDGDTVATSRSKQLTAAMEKAPDALKAIYQNTMKRSAFKDDEDFIAFLTEATADTDAAVLAASVRGSVFGAPPKTGGPAADAKPSAEVTARIEARNAETVAPAIVGMPTK